MYKTVSTTKLFHGIDINKIESLLTETPYKIKEYSKGETVALANSRLKGLYIVLSGSVRGEMLDYSGKTIKIEDIESPSTLAPAFLFGDGAVLPVNIISNGKSEILFIDKATFLNLLNSNQKLLMNYLGIISAKTVFLSEKIKFLSFQTIREKFTHYIVKQYREAGSRSFKLKQSQEKIAELFGVTRPALARVISEMNQEGIIKTRGKSIEILDLSKLSS